MKQLLHTLSGCCAMLFNRQATTHLSVFFFPNKLGAFRYILLVIALCGGTPALLSQTTWLGAINNNWNNPGNWMPAVVPLAADDVVIPSGGTQPTILGGTAAVAQSVTIASGATLTIQNMSSLNIEGDANYAIYNEGSVSNSGTITIGATASPGFYGIRNFGTFNNNATTGNISINRGSIGINNAPLGIFTNAGTIKIGDVATLNSTGVYNEADFQNAVGGILEISRTTGSGFYNLATGTLTNAGTITLGKEASISGSGFYNFNEIENQTGATINIDRTSAAIDNRPNTLFTNEGLIVIGFNFSVSTGIYNQAGVEFQNTGGEIRIDRAGSAGIDMRENTVFTTTGLIILGANSSMNAFGPGIYNYGGNFTNDGGEIRIDNVYSAGINTTYASIFVNPNFTYIASTFSNLNNGIITIGALGSFSSPGIYHASTTMTPSTFTNEGAITINSTSYVGIHINDINCTFNNTGSITIGNNITSSLSGPGINNNGTFNNTGGTISINRTAVGIQNGQSTSIFSSSGNITIGDVAMSSSFSPGITNYGSFTNTDATITIDRTRSGIYNTNSFTNTGTIKIGSIASMGAAPGINNANGTFDNSDPDAVITIDRITDASGNALHNTGSNAIFTHGGILEIGVAALAVGTGMNLASQGTFTVLASGTVRIENTLTQGITISSTLNNAGTIDIGLTTNIGAQGILTSFGAVLFKNEGQVSIDRATIHGIYHGNGTIENSGIIDIGKTIGIGNYGIYTGFNANIMFNNLLDGEINIDRASITGLRHDNGTFNNDGTLNMGSLASIGSWGLWNQATFNNTATGEIHVNRTSMTGMINNANTFTNFGEVYIGDLAAVGDHALYNALGATVRNEACALLSIFAPLNNLGTLVQAGLFKVNTLVAHTNTPGFTNNGIIEYAQINPIPNVINNDIIIEPIDGLCPMDVIQIGGMNSFTIATTWYQDETLTMPAGTYDAMANTFTPAGLSTGTHTLYFNVTDNVNTCTQIASIQITIFSMGILYVDEDATGANNGTSWTDAYNDLQDALAAACTCGSGQIWVADGTYYPDEGVGQTNDDRSSTFQLCNGVALYGGFSGWSGGASGGSDETMLSEREVATNETILSGDVKQDDAANIAVTDLLTAPSRADNAYHVVVGSGTGATTVLDGFTITAGNANEFLNSYGGGMYNDSGSPTVANCTFSGNTADFGGGMYNEYASSPSISNCTFSGNSASGTGGGMNNFESSPSITNSTFLGNMATSGGGMFNYYSSPGITNSVFSGNSASEEGGGIFNSNNCSPIITNTTISGNSAGFNGGGMYNISSPSLSNTIIWNNQDQSGTNTANASIFNDNTVPTITYSLIQNITTDDANGNKDGITDAANSNYPAFVTPVDPSTAPTTAGNLRLQISSPAINMGNNAVVTVPPFLEDAMGDAIDLDGNKRIVANTVDMGAYESLCIDPSGTIAGDVACANENAFLTFTATVGTAPFFVIIDGLNGNAEIMAGAGNGNPIWTFTPGSLPVGDHTFNLLSIRDANGCVFTGNPINSASITINPLPAGTIAGDIACANENAFLTFTATVGTAPFFVIIDGLNGNNEIMAGAGNGNPIWTFTPGSLAVGDHTFNLLSIRDANGCVFTGNPINSAMITINSLPTGTISSNFSAICAGESIELRFTATGGVGPFDIVVNGIPYNDVLSGSVFATLNPNSSTDYTLTQITDNNGCIAANLSQAISVTVTNCQATAIDPCTCKNNATTLTNGQFNETIQVMNAPTGQTWTVTAVNGLYDINSAAPPAAPTPIPVGTVLTESPAGSGTYILPGVHVDAQGYFISVSNGRGITFSLGNACVYPNPAITLDPAYCKDEPAILLTGTPGDANILSQSFKIDGMTATMLDPAALTVGNHTIEYTVDGGKAKEFGPNDPGCIQTVSQQVRIDPQVTVDAGSTQTICRTKTLSLAGLDLSVTYTGGNLADLEYSWSIVEAGNNGTLTGTNPTDPKVGTYTPGADAIARGYVTLRLTVDNPNDVCDAVSDTVRVNIQNVDCGAFPWNGN